MGFGICFSLGIQIETILQEEKRPFTTPRMFVSLPASSNVETYSKPDSLAIFGYNV
jgi:hypothetical protein